MAIETTLKRVGIITAALIGTGIVILINLNLPVEMPTKEVRDIKYTENEYVQLKSQITTIIENRKIKSPTYEEGEIWKDIVGQEMKPCGSVIFTGVNEDNLIDKLNERLKSPNFC